MKTLANESIEPVWARIRELDKVDITNILTTIELAYNLEENDDAPVLGWQAPVDTDVVNTWLIRVAAEVEAVRPGDDPVNYKLWARWGSGPTIKMLGLFRVE